jgi:hypothetical protein
MRPHPMTTSHKVTYITRTWTEHEIRAALNIPADEKLEYAGLNTTETTPNRKARMKNELTFDIGLTIRTTKTG